jgi:hypothetical protein
LGSMPVARFIFLRSYLTLSSSLTFFNGFLPLPKKLRRQS